MILVVSSTSDEHAEVLLQILAGMRAEARLFDIASIPQTSAVSMGFDGKTRDFRLISGGESLAAAQCTAVWWRRPGAYVPHPEISSPSHQQFVLNECHEAVTGFWQCLDAHWVNHPSRDHIANRKVYQLQIAQEVGLRIPRTLVTNAPSEAKAFVEALGPDKAIYKAFTATRQEWRETRLVKEQERQLFDNVKYAPVIFQEYIEADVDVRVTVVGDQMFAAAIHSQTSRYKVDFRMDMMNVDVEPLKLPSTVSRKLRKFMGKLGLVYGAIDLRRTPDGQYVFLEINPAGQWLFIESRTGQPITEALAAELAAPDTG